MCDEQPLNDALFAELKKPGMGSKACDAVNAYTREKMWRLFHIPARYFIIPDLRDDFRTLAGEINEKGCIDLDEDGQPAVLTGKIAKLAQLRDEGKIT
jgi:hypothetical protein